MTTRDETRTVHDPFLNRDVQVSNKLTDRLRGRYACGPIVPNGEPEFGWREFEVPPIQREAASALEAKDAEIARWKEVARTEAEGRQRMDALAFERFTRISDLERQLAEETERCARVAEATTVSSRGHPQIDAPTPTDMRSAIVAAIRGGAK